MAHELSTASGRIEMAFVGQTPWHGLGQRIPASATAMQAMHAAGLGWTVSKRPLAVVARSEHPSESRLLTRTSAIIRDDLWAAGKHDDALLGTAGVEYLPLQNREAFTVAEPIIGPGRGAFETAGALGRGDRVWILVRLDQQIRAAASDPLQVYVLLSNSHDGATGIEIKLTPVRVVCGNTLTFAMHFGPGLSIPHDRNAGASLAIARDLLLDMPCRCLGLQRLFQQMARTQIQSRPLAWFLLQVFPDPLGVEDEEGRSRSRAMRQTATRLFESGTGNRLPGVAGSLWAAVNGVTELLDHRPRTNPDEHLRSLWWGEIYRANQRALVAAQALLSQATVSAGELSSYRVVPAEPARQDAYVVGSR